MTFTAIYNPAGGAHVIYRHGTFGWYIEYLTEDRYKRSVSPEAGWYLSESDWIIPGTLPLWGGSESRPQMIRRLLERATGRASR